MQQSDRRSVHRKLLDMTSNTHELFWNLATCGILRSCWLIQPNASEVSILILPAVKAKFSTTTNSEKVSTNKCDIDGQPEIATWPFKPEVSYISESIFMTYIIKILTANLGFSTTARSKKISLGDSNNQRQLEMAANTGSTHIKSRRQIWDLGPQRARRNCRQVISTATDNRK